MYPSVDPPWTGAQDIERVKHSIEIGGLLQEGVMLVHVCYGTHDRD